LLRAPPANRDAGLIKVPAVMAAIDFSACRREMREDFLLSIEYYRNLTARARAYPCALNLVLLNFLSLCFDFVKTLLD
jgi:hypothetical protein